MQNPETRFINSIHRRLKPYTTDIEIIRINPVGRNGLPDYLYIGRDGTVIVWVEYKVYPNTLTSLQRTMVKRLRQKGHRVAIITKMPDTTTIEAGATLIQDVSPHDWILQTLGINNDATTATSQPKGRRTD